jgi:hypothetical protein
MDNTFAGLTNMVPLKSMVKGQRVIMGARMFTQALGLQIQKRRSRSPEVASSPGLIST